MVEVVVGYTVTYGSWVKRWNGWGWRGGCTGAVGGGKKG